MKIIIIVWFESLWGWRRTDETRILTTAAISAAVLWLMKASTREDKKKKKVLTAVFTRSCRGGRHQRHQILTFKHLFHYSFKWFEFVNVPFFASYLFLRHLTTSSQTSGNSNSLCPVTLTTVVNAWCRAHNKCSTLKMKPTLNELAKKNRTH